MTGPLAAWANFYVIVGSAAAALTGLQFVVMALVTDVRSRRASAETVDAFGTPTVVHFAAVLVISALLSAPWQSPPQVAAAVGASGIAGSVYGVIVLRRARRQTTYRPVLEDWIWHTTLPLVAYLTLVGAAVSLALRGERALFAIGGSTLLLLTVGIHNAWDTVTYVTVGVGHEDDARVDGSNDEA